MYAKNGMSNLYCYYLFALRKKSSSKPCNIKGLEGIVCSSRLLPIHGHFFIKDYEKLKRPK